MALTVLCLSFVILLLLGVPVAFAIGLSCQPRLLIADESPSRACRSRPRSR